jgi:hypothetical protein
MLHQIWADLDPDRKKEQKMQSQMRALVANAKSLPANRVTEELLPVLLKRAAENKESRSAAAKALSGDISANVPTSGKSKSAVNKSKKTMRKTLETIAAVLAPVNPNQAMQFMGSCGCGTTPADPSRNSCPGRIPMQPGRQNVHAPVLPQRRPRENVADDAKGLGEDVSTTTKMMNIDSSPSSVTDGTSPALAPPHSVPFLPQRRPRENAADDADRLEEDTSPAITQMMDVDSSPSTDDTSPAVAPPPSVTQASLRALMGGWSDDDDDDDDDSSVEQDDNDPLGYGAVENETSDVEDEATEQPSSKTKGRQGVKYWRKSMSFKSQEEAKKKIDALERDLGKELGKFIRSAECSTPSDRRPFLAPICEKHSRKTVCNYLNLHICKDEWWRIRIHNRYPGNFKPVEKEKIFRMRISEDLLQGILEFLEAPGNIQWYAFGSQLRKVLGGNDTVELDNVSRLKKLDKLTGDFIMGLCSEMEAMMADGLPSSECRCQKTERGTFRRCMKGRGHDGKCAFTPKGSISATTVRELISCLTAGDIKSLSGLDDVRVLKGRDNFKSLRDISKEVFESKEAGAIVKRIDDCELYYQTDYIPHLQVVGSQRCNCLTCGFHDAGTYKRKKKDVHHSVLCLTRNKNNEQPSSLLCRQYYGQ